MLKFYHSRRWIVAVLLLNFGLHCVCLRNVVMLIPSAIQRGQPAVFQCQFDLEGDSLYSVKWYKGQREFYRFSPTEIPPYKIFPLLGLNINREHSNASHLFLGPVDSSVSGRYLCEVSADAPSFRTTIVTGETNVVEVPKHTPTISGIKPKYRLGDTLRGNCTLANSKPAANLTWYINSEIADAAYVKPVKKFRSSFDTLETAYSILRFTINREHFENGRLKVRCVASIYNIYWKSTEKSVDEERPKLNINNAVTPNTLGVNQLPSSYDANQQHESYFDEDFPTETRHHHSINSVRHNFKPNQHSSETSSISSTLFSTQWSVYVTVICTLIHFKLL